MGTRKTSALFSVLLLLLLPVFVGIAGAAESTIPMDAYYNEKWQLFQPSEQVDIEAEIGGRIVLRAFYFTSEHEMYGTNVYGDDNGRGGPYTPPTGDIAEYNAEGQLVGVLAPGNKVDFQWYVAATATNDPADAAKLLYNHNDPAQGYVISNVHEVDTSAHYLGTNYYFVELTHTAPDNTVQKYYSAPVKVTVNEFTSYPESLMTAAEASGWRYTTTSAELVAYYKELERQSNGRIKILPTGRKTLGRAAAPGNATDPTAFLHRPSDPQDIQIAVISDPDRPVSSPADVGDRAVMFICGTPHSGECAGTEGTMLFAREAAVGEWDELLEDLVIIILPSSNLDGMDIKFAQRQNAQHLPKLVGTRFTGGVINPLRSADYNPTNQNDNWYNINRDMVKLDAPEARVLTDIFNTWDPVLFIDLHGTPEQMFHAQTWNVGLHPDMDPALFDYNINAFADLAVEKDSYLYNVQGKTARLYGISWRNDDNHYRNADNCEPRYTTNYIGLRNRMLLLFECYDFDPYPVRTDTQYGSIVGTMQAVQAEKDKIVQMLADSDAWARGRAKRGIDPDNPRDKVTLRAVLPTLDGPEYAANPDLIPEMEVENYRTNEVTGAILSLPIHDPTVHSLGITAASGDRVGTITAGLSASLYKANDRRRYVPVADSGMPGSVPLGAYYLFDKDAKGAEEILTLHGIEFTTLSQDITIPAENFQWFNATLRRDSNTYYEGRLMNSPSGGQTAGQVSGWVGNWTAVAEPQTIPAGTYVVSTSQPLGNLAALMLEPGCMDGLLNWTYSAEVQNQNPIQINFFDDCLDNAEGTIRANFKSDAGDYYIPIFKVNEFIEPLNSASQTPGTPAPGTPGGEDSGSSGCMSSPLSIVGILASLVGACFIPRKK